MRIPGRNSVIAAILASATILPSLPALAEQGDILVRLRGIGVIPTDESGGISPDLLTSGLDPQPAGRSGTRFHLYGDEKHWRGTHPGHLAP